MASINRHIEHKKNTWHHRRRRVRAKVYGVADRPRISVFKSNTTVYAQLIDDEQGVTITAASSRLEDGKTPSERAYAAGTRLADQAKTHKIKKAVFDRGGYIYTGRIRALADGAREGGLRF